MSTCLHFVSLLRPKSYTQLLNANTQVSLPCLPPAVARHYLGMEAAHLVEVSRDSYLQMTYYADQTVNVGVQVVHPATASLGAEVGEFAASILRHQFVESYLPS